MEVEEVPHLLSAIPEETSQLEESAEKEQEEEELKKTLEFDQLSSKVIIKTSIIF